MPADLSHASATVRLPTPEERALQLEAICRETAREQFWDTVGTLGACAIYSILGVLGLSWAVSTTNVELARVVFWASLSIANAGISFTLIAAYLRSVERTGG